MEKKPARAIALLPIGVFLVLYLGLGIVFEYVLKIEMGFYNIPIVVAFLASILVACLQNRALSFDEKLEVMAKDWSCVSGVRFSAKQFLRSFAIFDSVPSWLQVTNR